MTDDVVITGLGLVTPLGRSAGEVLARLAAGESAAARPSSFDPAPFACGLCAEVRDFRAEDYVGESKALRLMNRDAQLAVAAARLAVRDAGLRIGADRAPGDAALFAATGLATMPAAEIAQIVRSAAGDDGGLDLRRFGAVALKRVRPVLSFKILSNMPLCFVSIFEGVRGPSAVYAPWEGQGARAIAAGAAAIRRGQAPCALVGGCDVKTNALAFLALEQEGAFDPWRRGGRGAIPGEGAAFLVLEPAGAAKARGGRAYARLGAFAIASAADGGDVAEARADVLRRLGAARPAAAVAADDGDTSVGQAEQAALADMAVPADAIVRPKGRLGDLYAAAAAVQVALAAAIAESARGQLGELPPPTGRSGESPRCVLANCFGHGTEQAAFVLEAT